MNADGRRMSQFRVWGLRLPLGHSGEDEIRRALARGLSVRIEAIGPITTIRRSLDARDKERGLFWVFTLDVSLGSRPSRFPKGWRVGPVPPAPIASPRTDSRLRGKSVAVVGSGPAGLFSALRLASSGASVALLERGAPLKERVFAVSALWREGTFSQEANVQFGEGGAGTFSDGKLVTRVKDPRVRLVLEEFVRAGAPARILEEAHPHVGTDGIRACVGAIRERLLALGVQFRFQARVEDVSPDARSGWCLSAGNERLRCDAAFLAVGHSSRALFKKLLARGVPFDPKGFAVGGRAEHPQAWVDRNQYGRFAGHPDLPAAEYFLTYKDEATGRGVYSFCMCPGGMVINAASEAGKLVTNGMSMSHRASGLANAGIVATVTPDDWGGGPLGGIEFQEALEKKGYELGGNYLVPAQTLRGFVDGKEDASLPRVSYRPGARAVNLRGFFPPFIEEPLLLAMARFDKTMPGFIENGVFMVPETRTSCPLQVRRAADLSVEGHPGLYIVGEGAGWAGGIVSSAVDALRAAEAFEQGNA